jgi:hypothetical protein
VSEWVSVNDRLPDKDGEYLCVIYFKLCKSQLYKICYFAKDLYEVDELYFKDERGKSGFYAYDGEWGYYECSDVTHWMPLPELPKGE